MISWRENIQWGWKNYPKMEISHFWMWRDLVISGDEIGKHREDLFSGKTWIDDLSTKLGSKPQVDDDLKTWGLTHVDFGVSHFQTNPKREKTRNPPKIDGNGLWMDYDYGISDKNVDLARNTDLWIVDQNITRKVLFEKQKLETFTNNLWDIMGHSWAETVVSLPQRTSFTSRTWEWNQQNMTFYPRGSTILPWRWAGGFNTFQPHSPKIIKYETMQQVKGLTARKGLL